MCATTCVRNREASDVLARSPEHPKRVPLNYAAIAAVVRGWKSTDSTPAIGGVSLSTFSNANPISDKTPNNTAPATAPAINAVRNRFVRLRGAESSPKLVLTLSNFPRLPATPLTKDWSSRTGAPECCGTGESNGFVDNEWNLAIERICIADYANLSPESDRSVSRASGVEDRRDVSPSSPT